ncbi:hypothetical protein ABT369_11815 [Dactylosporangium sp. NPDC000244]|uniref:hypothetical protein n=1 Tax=Dactylosporangium sp. NPDC000244 TaxID=3154365 RepID=UPI003325F834
MRRGVYFLANDTVLEQAIAFLSSFRRFNPTIPLCLVPFADNVEQVAALASRFSFDVWQRPELLRECDDISKLFHGEVAGQYRKLAMWSGEFDEFVYIDCDTVVLHSIDLVFPHLAKFDFVVSNSNVPDARRWVWRDSIMRARALSPRQISYAANTGFVGSKKGLLDLDTVRAKLDRALALAPHMELLCREQPLLNYLIVTSGRPHTSLLAMMAVSGDMSIPLERWGGGDIGVVRDGQVVTPEGGSPTLLVHWAGEFQKVREHGGRIPHHELWSYYRDLVPQT